jgi:hypothetical protein
MKFMPDSCPMLPSPLAGEGLGERGLEPPRRAFATDPALKRFFFAERAMSVKRAPGCLLRPFPPLPQPLSRKGRGEQNVPPRESRGFFDRRFVREALWP